MSKKRCPFMKLLENNGSETTETFKKCLGEKCMAYVDEDTCHLIHKNDFKFIN